MKKVDPKVCWLCDFATCKKRGKFTKHCKVAREVLKSKSFKTTMKNKKKREEKKNEISI